MIIRVVKVCIFNMRCFCWLCDIYLCWRRWRRRHAIYFPSIFYLNTLNILFVIGGKQRFNDTENRMDSIWALSTHAIHFCLCICTFSVCTVCVIVIRDPLSVHAIGRTRRALNDVMRTLRSTFFTFFLISVCCVCIAAWWKTPTANRSIDDDDAMSPRKRGLRQTPSADKCYAHAAEKSTHVGSPDFHGRDERSKRLQHVSRTVTKTANRPRQTDRPTDPLTVWVFSVVFTLPVCTRLSSRCSSPRARARVLEVRSRAPVLLSLKWYSAREARGLTRTRARVSLRARRCCAAFYSAV